MHQLAAEVQSDPDASIRPGTRRVNGDLDDSRREVLQADFETRPVGRAMPGLVEDLLEDLSGSRRVEGGRHVRRGVDAYPSALGAAAQSVGSGAGQVDQVAILWIDRQLAAM